MVLSSHVENLAIKMPVPGALLKFVSAATAATKDRRSYTYTSPTHLTHSSLSSHDHTSLTHPFASIQNTLGLGVPSWALPDPLYAHCPSPPAFAKENSSMGRALTQHRLASRWLDP